MGISGLHRSLCWPGFRGIDVRSVVGLSVQMLYSLVAWACWINLTTELGWYAFVKVKTKRRPGVGNCHMWKWVSLTSLQAMKFGAVRAQLLKFSGVSALHWTLLVFYSTDTKDQHTNLNHSARIQDSGAEDQQYRHTNPQSSKTQTLKINRQAHKHWNSLVHRCQRSAQGLEFANPISVWLSRRILLTQSPQHS